MQRSGQANQLQLLFIELRVGLARSAIQSALLLNGGAAVALLLLLANILGSASQRGLRVDISLLKWAFAVFGIGLFLGGVTFVNAYVAQGAIASGQSNAFGNAMRRLGLGLILGALLLFLIGLGLVAAAI
jgi:hypothetical protein